MSELTERLAEALRDRYRVERQIGSGGMAVVYLAHDLKHGRDVALKVLRPEVGHELGGDRFLREIRIAAALSHPNILPLFDSGEADGLLYYVMPYVQGETLAERLESEGALPVEEAVRIAGEVGDALARAHEAGVVHRDIKPANILFESTHALVADFGIARAVDAAGGDRVTRTGVAVGTPLYMSPEQASGEGAVDARSDVYSLGCVAYEMLAGEPPFTGPTSRAVVAGHLSKPVPPLREHRDDVPAGVERALQRALAKDPEERFQTARALVEALAGAITAEARAREERRVARRRWTRAVAGIGTVAFLAGGGWLIRDAVTGPAIQTLAVLPASNMTRDPDQAYFVDGVHEALVTELQRAGIAVIARQSVLRYRDSDKPVRQIARELGVDALIKPVVGREGDSVLVDVSLYDADTELPLWTNSFGTRMTGVLGLYREISGRIADEIGAALSTEAEARLAERPIVDPRMIEAVLVGQMHLGRYTPEEINLAQRYFEFALERDSLYAPAHVGLGSVWAYRAQAGLISPREAQLRAGPHLDKALEIDPELPSARAAQATTLVYDDWDFEAAEEAFRRALALDPNDARTQAFYGHLLMILGRSDEALERGERAVELDPLEPLVTGLHGVILVGTGHHSEAIAALEVMRDENPGSVFPVTPLIGAYHSAGRHEEEFELRRSALAGRGQDAVVEAMDRGLREGGYDLAWQRAAETLASPDTGPANGLTIAELYMHAGMEVEAVEWIERELARRNRNLPYIGVIPFFRPLHDNPRFRAVVEEVGVPLLSLDRAGQPRERNAP